MANNIEWVGTEERPQFVPPAEINELDPEDSTNSGLYAGNVMIYGTPDQLRGWLLDALLAIYRAENPQSLLADSDLLTPAEAVSYLLRKDN